MAHRVFVFQGVEVPADGGGVEGFEADQPVGHGGFGEIVAREIELRASAGGEDDRLAGAARFQCARQSSGELLRIEGHLLAHFNRRGAVINTKNKNDSLNLVLTNNLTRSLSREEMRDVEVQVLKGVVYISLSDNMLYQSGSYSISDQAGEILGKVAKIIKDYDGYEVLIEGNTDNVPISMVNIRNNWDLSTLRASSVVQSLQNTYGVDPKRLTAGGRGEFNPVADNETEAGKAKNRRTQIIITPKLDQFMELIGKAPESK